MKYWNMAKIQKTQIPGILTFTRPVDKHPRKARSAYTSHLIRLRHTLAHLVSRRLTFGLTVDIGRMG